MNICQSTNCIKDLSWLHFYNDPRLYDKQQLLDHQFYTPVSVTYVVYLQVATRSTSHNMTTVFTLYGRSMEIKSNFKRKSLHIINQGFNFLRGSSSNKNNVRAPIQFRRERQPQHLKRWFFVKNRPIHFHINSTSVIKPVKWNKLCFSSIESTSHFLQQSTVSCRSD